jgi:hypothetical protein
MATRTIAIGTPSFTLGTAAGASLLDEDDMSSNSATDVPSQQSVKAYVDSNSGSSGNIDGGTFF